MAIHKSRATLVWHTYLKSAVIKQSKPLPKITPENIPHDLPKGWEWIRLGEVANYNGRKNINSDEIPPDMWLLDLEDIEKDTSRIIYRAKYSERQSKSTKSTFQKGDVLYGKLRPYLNKVVVADADGVCTTEIVPIVLLGDIDSQFFKWLLKRSSFLDHVNNLMYGVKMPRLGTDDANMSIHPLPPLAEQRRIVAKIDQLMARCDELEKLRSDRAQKLITVHTAALNRLLSSSSASSLPCRRESSPLDSRLHGNDTEFTEAWRFITQHFSELYSVKATVAELRKTILQLAVMGKLVPQDPNDEPASELLKAIELEKQRLVKEGKIKQPKSLPNINMEEVPYDLPKDWEWVRLGVITQIKGGKRVSNGYKLLTTPTPYIYIRVTDMKNGSIDDSDLHFIDEEMHTKIRQYIICKEDIYMTIVGATIGKCGTIPEKFHGMHLTENAARIILNNFLDKLYVTTQR